MSHNNKVFLVTYTSLVVLPVMGLLAILRYGRTLVAPASAGRAWTLHPGIPAAAERSTLMPNLFTLVLQIAVIVAVSRLVGNLFGKIRQPRVVGEMFAGI